jgi:hypothetical protein
MVTNQPFFEAVKFSNSGMASSSLRGAQAARIGGGLCEEKMSVSTVIIAPKFA